MSGCRGLISEAGFHVCCAGKVQGFEYSFDGTPDPSGSGVWCCSSARLHVFGHIYIYILYTYTAHIHMVTYVYIYIYIYVGI